jgi:hypothetical protein
VRGVDDRLVEFRRSWRRHWGRLLDKGVGNRQRAIFPFSQAAPTLLRL